MKSEQLIQNELFSHNVTILDKYECFSLGATTISSLIKSNYIKKISIPKSLSKKKPDVLILDNDKNIVVYCEQKHPNKFKSDKDISIAINQEIDAAIAVNASIYVVNDGEKFIWVNPHTKEPILDENGNIVNLKITPKDNAKQIARLIHNIKLSISKDNNSILKKEFLDPTPLAQKINKILVNLTFASSKMSLYTFVELFLFKYLSDIGVLTGENSFQYIANMYKDSYKNIDPEINDAKILAKYFDYGREKMSVLFPQGNDGTSIINGRVFHVTKNENNDYISEDNTDKIFKEVILAFEEYEKENGKFINISRDFKSKLFETFMKNSEEKSGMGQFFTPIKIVEEMIAMVDIKEGMSICDPACGVGKFLLESIEGKELDLVKYENNKLIKKVNLVGYDKIMFDKDDITIILAKANMLIYFSELFKNNNNVHDIKKISKGLLNESFKIHKSTLGTLDKIEENSHDLILANPPFYQSKIISDEAKSTKSYTLNGSGIEGLFLEWILKSLKYGGVANVVLPDGIFSNNSNKKIKEHIRNFFFIDSIISLPVNAFFNTPKKTYILTIRKKTETEIENNLVQEYPVFTYICKSIGESLDSYRFDLEDNDLKNAVSKYNFYRKQDKNEDIPEFLLNEFSTDKKLKLLPISNFSPESSWIIENYWTEGEKIELGLKKERKTMSIEEFQYSINEIISLMEEFKGKLECIKQE